MDTGTEVAETTSQLPVEATTPLGYEGLDQADIVLPRCWLMQPLSKFVIDEKRKKGEIVSSLTEEPVDAENPAGPVEFVVISSKKVWYQYKLAENGNDYDFEKIYDHNAFNANDDWQFENGRRAQCLYYYVLFTKEIEVEKEGEEVAMPHCVSFMNTNRKEGQKLVTLLKQQEQLRKPVWGKTYTLSQVKNTNDKGTFWNWVVAKKDKATDDQMAAAYKWYVVLKKDEHKVAAEETEKVEEAEVTVAPLDDSEVPF